jgi:hypothetical protein
MIARIRELPDHDLRSTAYRYHPRRGSSTETSTFKSMFEENDTTFGRMCFVIKSLDKMHADLQKGSKVLNDKKLVKIPSLEDEISCLKKENAML